MLIRYLYIRNSSIPENRATKRIYNTFGVSRETVVLVGVKSSLNCVYMRFGFKLYVDNTLKEKANHEGGDSVSNGK